MKASKRLLALLLALVMTLALGIGALADTERSADERLAAVTLAVKRTLGLSDEYTDFTGYLSREGSDPYWNLNWSSDAGSVNVTANEQGKIYDYSKSDDEYRIYDNWYSFRPTFPAVTGQQALDVANSFLAKVLTSGESVTLEEPERSARESSYYYFDGALRIQGLETPINIRITVSCADLSVTNFYRSDAYTTVKGGYPTSTPTVSKLSAGLAYRNTFKFELRWMLTGEDTAAKLVYVPVHEGEWVIDAITGEATDLSESWQGYIPSPSEAPDAAYGLNGATEAEKGLSPTELAGISKIEGALTAQQLDAIVRAKPIFGVTDGFKVSNTYYYYDNENETLTASVRYVRNVESASEYGIDEETFQQLLEDGYSPRVYKSFNMDGKTGEIKDVRTSYTDFGWKDTEREPAELPANVASWLNSNYPNFAKTGVYKSYSSNYAVSVDSYEYQQKVDGYFFANNCFYITVNPKLSCIDNLSISWDDEVTFGASSPLVGDGKAYDAYATGYEMVPMYVPRTSGYDDNWNTVFDMMLAYVPRQEGSITGVDAITGKLISDSLDSTKNKIVYDDIENNYAKSMILELAEYGVGYYGGHFLPTAKLTQLDLILLLLSANGYVYEKDALTEEDIDYLYSVAEDLKIIGKGQREPEHLVTKAELVKTFVELMDMGKAAMLKGIFVTGFSDDSSIPEEYYGYVAIAKGLGLITGDPSGAFHPNAGLTRTEAAVMLWKFMDRDR